MTVDLTVVPGLLLAAELAALAAVGYVVVRVALRQTDDLMALAQGLVVGLALWGLIVNFVMYVVPGMAGTAAGWGIVLALVGDLVWPAPDPIRPPPRMVAVFGVAVAALAGMTRGLSTAFLPREWRTQVIHRRAGGCGSP